MSTQLTNEFVDGVENDLRFVECKLEQIGRSVCDADGGQDAWTAINRSLASVREAVGCLWKMYPAG